jgi:hypothetical protein
VPTRGAASVKLDHYPIFDGLGKAGPFVLAILESGTLTANTKDFEEILEAYSPAPDKDSRGRTLRFLDDQVPSEVAWSREQASLELGIAVGMSLRLDAMAGSK